MWHKIRVQFNSLPVDIQFLQHCLLKRLSFSVLCIFGALIEDLIVMDLSLCSLFCSSLHVYLYGRTSLRRIRFQFSSVAQSCLTLCDPMNRSTPGVCPSPTPGVYPNPCALSQWCHPAISSSVIPFSSCLQSFPNIRVFSNESALRIRWPKYWSFNFNIRPSNEHPGLISFRID